MRMYDIITTKKHGGELTPVQIRELVREYTDGAIPDYQMSALLMAICFNGMTDTEIAALTDAMAHSGKMVDLSEFGALAVDKHSTGGVGDKTTLIVAPLVAAIGCKVAKMTGRGLGHTGGTADKLESFPGYNLAMSEDGFFEQVRNIGIAVMGQSEGIAPADKKLYALRDVTATVDSIPLITSSIMSKKLAAGAKSIVLDVKYGSGSFMKTAQDAEVLAKKMVDIGRACGRNMAALITNMDMPLGHNVGNILEVKEAIATLQGNGPRDLTEICLSLASTMAHLALGITLVDARERAEAVLESGAAFRKFKEWIAAQGGNADLADTPSLFPTAKISRELLATADGYITHMNAEKIGLASVELGAGRATKDAVIDHTAGIILHKKTGDVVRRGDVIATLYTNDKGAVERACQQMHEGIEYGASAPKELRLIHKLVV